MRQKCYFCVCIQTTAWLLKERGEKQEAAQSWMKYLHQQTLNMLERPCQSTKLNPTNNLWQDLQINVRRCHNGGRWEWHNPADFQTVNGANESLTKSELTGANGRNIFHCSHELLLGWNITFQQNTRRLVVVAQKNVNKVKKYYFLLTEREVKRIRWEKVFWKKFYCWNH